MIVHPISFINGLDCKIMRLSQRPFLHGQLLAGFTAHSSSAVNAQFCAPARNPSGRRVPHSRLSPLSMRIYQTVAFPHKQLAIKHSLQLQPHKAVVRISHRTRPPLKLPSGQGYAVALTSCPPYFFAQSSIAKPRVPSPCSRVSKGEASPANRRANLHAKSPARVHNETRAGQAHSLKALSRIALSYLPT